MEGRAGRRRRPSGEAARAARSAASASSGWTRPARKSNWSWSKCGRSRPATLSSAGVRRDGFGGSGTRGFLRGGGLRGYPRPANRPESGPQNSVDQWPNAVRAGMQQRHQRHQVRPASGTTRNTRPARTEHPQQHLPRPRAGARASRAANSAPSRLYTSGRRNATPKWCAEAAANGAVAIKHRGHQVFRGPEAATLSNRRSLPATPASSTRPTCPPGARPETRQTVAGFLRGTIHMFQPILTERSKANTINASCSDHRNRRGQPERNRARALLASHPEGQSGVRRITRFDPSGFGAGGRRSPDEFDEKTYVNAKDRPHVSRAVPLGGGQRGGSLEDAGIDRRRHDARRAARHRRDRRLRRRQPGVHRRAVPPLSTPATRSSAASTPFPPAPSARWPARSRCGSGSAA